MSIINYIYVTYTSYKIQKKIYNMQKSMQNFDTRQCDEWNDLINSDTYNV